MTGILLRWEHQADGNSRRGNYSLIKSCIKVLRVSLFLLQLRDFLTNCSAIPTLPSSEGEGYRQNNDSIPWLTLKLPTLLWLPKLQLNHLYVVIFMFFTEIQVDVTCSIAYVSRKGQFLSICSKHAEQRNTFQTKCLFLSATCVVFFSLPSVTHFWFFLYIVTARARSQASTSFLLVCLVNYS